MDEDPKDHDFDQRKDGPLQRPSVHIATDLPRRTKSHEDEALEQKESARSAPPLSRTTSPNDPHGWHASQMTRAEDGTPRRSTDFSRHRSRRSSRDFDIRRDGPFGRPSLTMVRRQSSGLNTARSPTSPGATGPEHAVEEETKEEEARPPPDRVPTSIETLQCTTDAAFEPEPPPLNYTLWTRKMSIFIFWSLILIDSIAMPIVLYFCLWYLTDLSPNTVFSIVTAALGGISIVEYFVRFWRLWKKGSTCRVIGARRMYLDWFHWNFTFAWIVVMIELIVGSVPEHPPIRLLAMPLASMCYCFGTELLIFDTLRYFEIPAPCRISSIPKGAQLRPAIYSIIEDVVAVDGSGGTEFRENLNKRYEASHVFRAMLRRLGMYWAFGAETTAVITTILIFTVGKDAAYVIGWSLPFIWAGIWTVGTIIYVKKKLREEKTAWAEEVARKSNA